MCSIDLAFMFILSMMYNKHHTGKLLSALFTRTYCNISFNIAVLKIINFQYLIFLFIKNIQQL